MTHYAPIEFTPFPRLDTDNMSEKDKAAQLDSQQMTPNRNRKIMKEK